MSPPRPAPPEFFAACHTHHTRSGLHSTRADALRELDAKCTASRSPQPATTA